MNNIKGLLPALAQCGNLKTVQWIKTLERNSLSVNETDMTITSEGSSLAGSESQDYAGLNGCL